MWSILILKDIVWLHKMKNYRPNLTNILFQNIIFSFLDRIEPRTQKTQFWGSVWKKNGSVTISKYKIEKYFGVESSWISHKCDFVAIEFIFNFWSWKVKKKLRYSGKYRSPLSIFDPNFLHGPNVNNIKIFWLRHFVYILLYHSTE